MSIKITKMVETENPEDCHKGMCVNEAVYEIENMEHGTIAYSCENHRNLILNFEIDYNLEN